MTEDLKPCPWCGAGQTQVRENGRMWTGQRHSEPTSVSVVHWCGPEVVGQPSRMIERVGRDSASAIAAWNTRAASAQSGWRPISEAPRTFSPPISTNNHHAPEILGLYGQAFYCVCSWGGTSQPYWIDSENRRVPFQPTHWMPLQAAPQRAPGDASEVP